MKENEKDKETQMGETDCRVQRGTYLCEETQTEK